MSLAAFPALFDLASEYAPEPGRVYAYGTAGFRMPAALLAPVFFRVGIVACLRSAVLDRQTVGVMITASHNPPPDNGVKVVEPMGEMLPAEWETIATDLVNAPSEDLAALLDRTLSRLRLSPANLARARIVYARDTRPSGIDLSRAFCQAVDALGASADDLGVRSTPELHHAVRSINTSQLPQPYGQPERSAYIDKLLRAFATLVRGRPSTSSADSLVVDCANGVGALVLKDMVGPLAELGLRMTLVNTATDEADRLNEACGADFVKSKQALPPSLASVCSALQRACSLDGDADRIVYYYQSQGNQFHLLDGDRIAALASLFLSSLISTAGFTPEEVDVGVVQTAYANGNATKFIAARMPTACVPTGVKHLHHAAAAHAIGVYFEPNGHGTILFSERFLNLLRSKEPSSPSQQVALEQLRALTEFINQAVGDAISDLLLVEVILRHKAWSVSEWTEMYTDYPNALHKVTVPDRGAFKTTDAERRLEAPVGLQAKIDEVVAQYEDGRSFVRPSGTEDCVRVYAEARVASEAYELGLRVCGLVHDAVSHSFVCVISVEHWKDRRAIGQTTCCVSIKHLLYPVP